MASKKEGKGRSMTAWLIVIVTLLFMFAWVVIPADYLIKSLKVEREFSVALGGRAADQWIYGKMMEVSIEQAKDMSNAIKRTETEYMPPIVRGWLQERMIVTWLWASLILYRANMMLLYFFILIPFLIAISLDGFWVKEISTYKFSSQSPIRHRFGVILSTWTTIAACIWVILPAPIPSVVAPLAIVSLGFATWMWMANLQKRI